MSHAFVSLSSVWWAIGSAVLQFLWQGALVGLFAATWLACLRRRAPGERYAVAGGAMLFCFLAFCVSFARALSDVSVAGGVGALQVSSAPGAFAEGLRAGPTSAGVAAWCWVVGVFVMALRFGLQSLWARRLKTRDVHEVEPSWQRLFRDMQRELGISRSVRLLRSGLAEVPMVVGWLSPIVLVPAAAFTGLGPDQLRSLLAHELAHIRRRDHLFNAAQAVVESVLFFHPVVWWLSKQVRVEREYCCDDSSVRLTGDPKLLAEALAAMASLRLARPLTHSALAANGGPLMQRIQRILGVRPDGRTSLSGWQLPAGLALAGVLALTGSASSAPAQDARGDAVAQERRARDLEKVKAELTAAVKAGKITEAQAKERLVELKRREAQALELGVEVAKVKAELDAAVKAGKITERQAQERMAAWKKDVARRMESRDQGKKVWAELQTAVEAGRITEAQAKERFADWQKRATVGRDLKAQLAAVRAELDAAVRSGRMPQAQADESFAAYRKSLSTPALGRGGVRADPEAVIKHIQAAVEKGEMTPAEGKAKIEAYRKSMAKQKASQTDALEQAKRKIEAAVEAGRLTPEEGRARLDDARAELESRSRRQKRERR